MKFEYVCMTYVAAKPVVAVQIPSLFTLMAYV